jgi:hypothetical protein
MTEPMPKDTVVALRQVLKGFKDGWPQWFREMEGEKNWHGWITLLSTAANDLEQMQKLNGYYHKILYPD